MHTEAKTADDARFMREALAEARAAAELGEVPIGAVVVRSGEIIARAHNRRELDGDPSAHAEFSAIVAASHTLGRWRLADCTVYVTLEPCPMCAGLMVNARVGRCVYGAADPKAGALGSLYRLNGDTRLNHAFEAVPGVLADECAGVLRAFFAARRKGGARRGESMPDAPADVAHEAARSTATFGSSDLSVNSVSFPSAAAASSGPTPFCEMGTVPALAAPTHGGAASPRVLIAMDSFKGCASSTEVEEWAAEGIRLFAPAAEIACLPVADGGEGTVAAARAALGGELRETTVAGPFGDPIAASYLLAGDVAVVEMAAAAGLPMSPCTCEAALRASTFGVGEFVLDAVRAGAQTVYVGLGGSCTNDGGAGFLQAIGARLLDADGSPIAPGLAGLRDLASLDLGPARVALGGVRIIALTDVSNPLVGTRGALAVFGPQKGLPQQEAAGRDRDMIAYGHLLDQGRTHSVLGVPGAGAAGGLGAALLAVGAQLASGIDAILDLIGFDRLLERVEFVITGEGFIDDQTARGKAPMGVAARAKRVGKPVVALVGGRTDDLSAVYDAGIDLVLPICRMPMAHEQAMSRDEARRNISCAAESAIRAHALR